MTTYQISNVSRGGGFLQLSSISTILEYKPHQTRRMVDNNHPKRKTLEAIQDDGTFIKPLKQCFMRNPRLRPMTRVMLSLLSGWNGAGKGGVKTTTSIIAKHLSRSRRMVFNYLQEAVEEGYLFYTKITDKMGYYIGIKVFLNFRAIRKSFKKPEHKDVSMQETHKIRDVKYSSERNTNSINKIEKDEELKEVLTRMALKIGYISGESSSHRVVKGDMLSE